MRLRAPLLSAACAAAALANLTAPPSLHAQEHSERPIYFDGEIGWNGAKEILKFDTRTQEVVRLTFSNAADRDPNKPVRTSRFAAPSPDGKAVAFMSDMHGEGLDDIYVMNADGGDIRRLTHEPDRYFGAPTWSPDGKSIAFNETRLGVIHIIALKTLRVRRLTPESPSAFFPSWSPDGKSVAFSGRASSEDDIDIFVIDVESKDVRRVTDNPAIDRQPDWSADGSELVFDSNRDGNWEIYVMNADGSAVRRLTNHPAVDTHAAWSPDGRSIVFHSLRQGGIPTASRRLRPSGRPAAEIYAVSVDGSGLRRLAFAEASYAHPDW